jgi:hypothetical protein
MHRLPTASPPKCRGIADARYQYTAADARYQYAAADARYQYAAPELYSTHCQRGCTAHEHDAVPWQLQHGSHVLKQPPNASMCRCSPEMFIIQRRWPCTHRHELLRLLPHRCPALSIAAFVSSAPDLDDTTCERLRQCELGPSAQHLSCTTSLWQQQLVKAQLHYKVRNNSPIVT